jgi:anhydro-N-acetylmuramic acid kinase
MSGTSHDGLDIAHCSFVLEEDIWRFTINAAETIPYTQQWRELLMNLPAESQATINKAHKNWGILVADAVNNFVKKYGLDTDLIASHGHTVFHEPAKKRTLQIGDGAIIARETKIMVVNDFRTNDVAMGGEGAPLVPVGDRYLFTGYDYCLNIGGFSNISFEEKSQRLAFDICPANIVLNELAGYKGLSYDNKGRLAAKGRHIPALFGQLESLAYYQMEGPRSLGKEWVDQYIFPIIRQYKKYPPEDLLATYTEHAAVRIAHAAHFREQQSMLITGGGAYNEQLIKRIRHHCKASIQIPDSMIIDYKEALIFAFLGVLRLRNEINVYGSVTGSGKDHCTGLIHMP